MLKLLDQELLIVDDAVDHVADRDDADQLAIFEDRKMAHGSDRHEGHAFVDRLVGAHA